MHRLKMWTVRWREMERKKMIIKDLKVANKGHV
jgi:hypothetical protein